MQGNNIWDEAIEIEKKLKQLQIENELYANMKIGPVIHPYDNGYTVKANTEVYSLSEATQNDPIKIADKCLDKIIEYLDHRSIDVPVSGTFMTAPMVYSEDLKTTIQTLREVISNDNNSTTNRGN